MKLIWFILLLIFKTPLVLGASESVVHHPAPQKPVFVSEDWYISLKTLLPAPPKQGSIEQKGDEQELLEYQKTRTASDCKQAKTEVLVSLSSFFGSAGSPITKTDIEKLSPFFEQLRNDADYFIQRLKKDFPRERPFIYLKDLKPCVPKEVTGSYPSGHAVLAKLFGLILSDIYPEQKNFIDIRSKQIAEHRVMVGMHHRTDIEAGQKLGALIFKEFKASLKFQEALKENIASVTKQK